MFLLPAIASDTLTYCAYAIKAVDLHEVPYADFAVEYPPISLWAICLPRFLSRTPYPHEEFQHEIPGVLLREYRQIFRVEMFLADAMAFVLMLLAAARLRPASLTMAAWGYVATGAALAPVLYDRLDVGLALLLMIWVYAAVRASEGVPASWRWDGLACAALGVAIAFKWAPVVAVPYFLFGMCGASGQWKRAWISAAMVAVFALVPFLVHVPFAGMEVWQFLQFHGQRATEIESVYATAMMAASALHGEIVVEAAQGSGCWELAGPWSEILAQFSLALLLALYLAIGVAAWRRRREFDRRAGLQWAGMILIVTVAFSKVLSPQYFLWALPLMLVFGVGAVRPYALLVAMIFLLGLLTTWVFPFHFLQGRHPETAEILAPAALLQGLGPVRSIHAATAAVLVARNVLLLAATAWLAWGVFVQRARDEN